MYAPYLPYIDSRVVFPRSISSSLSIPSTTNGSLRLDRGVRERSPSLAGAAVGSATGLCRPKIAVGGDQSVASPSAAGMGHLPVDSAVMPPSSLSATLPPSVSNILRN